MRWPLGRVEVAGNSMLPALGPGDWLVVRWSATTGRRIRSGAVVVLRRPDRPELLVVKRVGRVLDDGRLWVIGDNPSASDDSRLFGPVGPESVVGRVLGRYRRAPDRSSA